MFFIYQFKTSVHLEDQTNWAASWENEIFAYRCENKGADQLCVTAQLISTFVFATRIVQFLFFINLKFQESIHLLYRRTGRFVSDLVGNPKDRFSRVAAQLICSNLGVVQKDLLYPLKNFIIPCNHKKIVRLGPKFLTSWNSNKPFLTMGLSYRNVERTANRFS